jgi:Na+-translocating ferredoxin:NAD+ oxidoreductase subunit C
MRRGIKLEQKQALSLRNPVEDLPVPEGFSAPKMFAPLRKSPPPARILQAAQTAGIVDELDGAPLETKLTRLSSRRIGLLIACGFDEDPCASAEQAFLRENSAEVADGLALAAEAAEIPAHLLAAASRAEARRIPKEHAGDGALWAGPRYPAGTLLLRKLSRRGKRAALIGAQACAALSRAVRKGRAQSEILLTAGDGEELWKNLRVRLGTPASAVAEGILPAEEIRAVVVGSSVSGKLLSDFSAPVTADTRCVIVLRRAPRNRTYPCVGCGRCVDACPRGIFPWMSVAELERKEPDLLRLANVQNCDRCAACSAVCPSGIDLCAAVKRAAEIKGGGCP